MSTFVFLHVGQESLLPGILTRSIRARDRNARIIQCSDSGSPAVALVDDSRRFDGDADKLMTFRLRCFAELGLTEPALYLDTDMMLLRPVRVDELLDDCDAALCRREFERDTHINPAFKDMNLSEYAGKTLGEVYPYIACATMTKTWRFWEECSINLKSLDAKFHYWYGDQEAIRNVANSGIYKTKDLPESIYGCLPEMLRTVASRPCLVHFKGPSRKALMIDCGRRLGLI